MADLGKLEQQIVEKLNHYFSEFAGTVALKSELREGLEIVDEQLREVSRPPPAREDEKEGLFATTRIWQCAACSTQLGKFEGKLDKHKPWSVFPNREHTPSKLGGFGYLGHIEKVIKMDPPESSLDKHEKRPESLESTKPKQRDSP